MHVRLPGDFKLAIGVGVSGCQDKKGPENGWMNIAGLIFEIKQGLALTHSIRITLLNQYRLESSLQLPKRDYMDFVVTKLNGIVVYCFKNNKQ